MSSANLSISHPAARRVRRAKAQKRTRAPGRTAAPTNGDRESAAAGTLTRTKALLLAALRVWELKHRIRD